MSVRLKDTAYKVYQDLEQAVKGDWNNLCSTLEKRFKTVKQPQLYKTKFQTTKQLPNDTLLELGNRIRTLARKAYPDVDAVLRDELARDQFVRSLDNVELTLKLRHNIPGTLDDAIRMAIDWQTVEVDVRKLKMSGDCKDSVIDENKSSAACSATTQETSLMTMMNEVLTLMKEDREEARKTRRPFSFGRGRGRAGSDNVNDYKCYICGSNQHLKRNCPKNGVCWSCGREGHLRADCPNLKQGQSGNDK